MQRTIPGPLSIDPATIEKVAKYISDNKNIKVVLWDVDGTLTDDGTHKEKHEKLAEKAYKISKSESMELNGVNDKKTYEYLFSKSAAFQKLYPNVEDYTLACRHFFETHAMDPNSEYRIKARQGATELVHELSDLGIHQACVTSAPDWQTRLNINALNISENMHFVQMLSDGIQAKPHPELYELAFEKMAKKLINLKKSEVLVIEDSISGVAAARAAGLSVIHCRMDESAPVSDQTDYHSFTFAQVKKIMIKNFDVPLRPPVLDNSIPLSKDHMHKDNIKYNRSFMSTTESKKSKVTKTENCNDRLKKISGHFKFWPTVCKRNEEQSNEQIRVSSAFHIR